MTSGRDAWGQELPRRDASPGPGAGQRPGAPGLPALQHAAHHQDVPGGGHHRPSPASEEGFRQPRGRPETRRPPVLPQRPRRGPLPQSPPERHGEHLPLLIPGLRLLLPGAQPLCGPDALPPRLPGPPGAHCGLPGEAAGAHPLPGLHGGPGPLRLHGPADHLGSSPPPVTSH